MRWVLLTLVIIILLSTISFAVKNPTAVYCEKLGSEYEKFIINTQNEVEEKDDIVVKDIFQDRTLSEDGSSSEDNSQASKAKENKKWVSKKTEGKNIESIIVMGSNIFLVLVILTLIYKRRDI